MKLSSRLKIVIMVAVISLALVFLDKFKMPFDNYFWHSVFEFGHVPLFGIISIALLGLSQTLFGRRYSNPLVHYAIAFFLTGLMGFVTELFQYFTPRDADIWDIVNDVIGAICFLGFYLTLDRRVSITGMAINNKLKYFIRLIVFLLGLFMITPTVVWIAAYSNRNLSFPDICTFELPWEQKFVFADNDHINIVPAPFNSDDLGVNHVGQMLIDNVGNSSFLIGEPYIDWTGFENFTFIVFSKHDESINLEFRINDWWHDNNYYDRFNRTLIIKPGLNKIIIPLEEVKNAPNSRVMKMNKIKAIVLFTEYPIENFDVYIDDFKLE
ncbi:MAG: hypothetical protein GY865_13360 [candidate division Zixibacteria bacterium]|nr:hypothetical protein [candidate division Zixibacteria bacterium]